MAPIKFRLNLTYSLGGGVVEEFQAGHHGGYLGYRNGMIFSNSHLLNTPMLPIYSTYHLEAAVI